MAIREESAGGGISYLIATMDSVIEVVANLLRIHGDGLKAAPPLGRPAQPID